MKRNSFRKSDIAKTKAPVHNSSSSSDTDCYVKKNIRQQITKLKKSQARMQQMLSSSSLEGESKSQFELKLSELDDKLNFLEKAIFKMNRNEKESVRKKRYKKRRSKNATVNNFSSSSGTEDTYSSLMNDMHNTRRQISMLHLQMARIRQILSSSSSEGVSMSPLGLKQTELDNQEMKAALARRTVLSTMDDTDDIDSLDSPDSIEEGVLAIPDSNTNSTPKELWRRDPAYSIRKLPEDNSPVLVFEILSAHIMPPEGDDPKVKRYVVYELTVRQDTRVCMDQQPATIERRYTDFRDMYSCLKRDYPLEMSNISFPNKVLVGNFSLTLIAERGQAFEVLLNHICCNPTLRSTSIFLEFLQDNELTKACQLLDERNDACIPLLENSFMFLNKIFMDRSKPVLLILCRLVAACSSPVPHPSAEKWAALALNRYETLCDIDLLPLYIPLLHTCAHLWWQKGRDQKPISDRLSDMSKKGISINNNPTLIQAIHKLDPRSETI